MALSDYGIKHTLMYAHTCTHLYGLRSHITLNTHMLTLPHNYQPSTQTHLSHTCTNCAVSCRLDAKCSTILTFTSIDDCAAVVEDYSALVQSRNCVEEVEGPQIPLKLQLRAMTFCLFLM